MFVKEITSLLWNVHQAKVIIKENFFRHSIVDQIIGKLICCKSFKSQNKCTTKKINLTIYICFKIFLATVLPFSQGFFNSAPPFGYCLKQCLYYIIKVVKQTTKNAKADQVKLGLQRQLKRHTLPYKQVLILSKIFHPLVRDKRLILLRVEKLRVLQRM